MSTLEDQDVVEGDAASIILNPVMKRRPAVPTPRIQSFEDIHTIEEPKTVSADQKKAKLEGKISAALILSKNKDFPDTVRASFREKADRYKKELASI
jgi:hypothetical protein